MIDGHMLIVLGILSLGCLADILARVLCVRAALHPDYAMTSFSQ